MNDEKKVIEKRLSLRGWKERNRGKPQQKIYIIAAVTLVLIFSSLLIYQYLNKNPVTNANSSTDSNNSSLIKVTPKTSAPKTTTPKATPVVTPEINKSIIGTMGTPFILNEFEINVTRVDSSSLYTNIWIIAKNTADTEKPFKIGPSSVIIDNIGLQYERVQVARAGISQTNLTAKAMRQGAIFFEPLREGRNPKKLILNINGQKAEIMLEK